MSLGEKLRAARLEAGISQRTLCGSTITRNMLSQIENGVAKPSMATLQYLAGQLGKPVSYFLEEAPMAPANPPLLAAIAQLEHARRLVDAGKTAEARKAVCSLPYEDLPDWAGREAVLLRWQLEPEHPGQLASALPSLDPELLLRAQAALEANEPQRCISLLFAAESQGSDWALAMGEALLLQKKYQEATHYFHQAEEAYPHRTSQTLEICYRELEDYQKAYFYACRVRNLGGR